MKLSNLRKAALLVLTGSGLLTAAANAATYTAGDLLLGVRASGGTGATSDIVIDLGPASNFTGASTSSTVINIASDLSTQFGGSWASRTDVFFGISGTPGGSTVGSDGPKTLYGTSAEITTGTLTTPWARGSSTAQGLATSKMSAMATAFTQGATASSAANGVVQATTDANNYATYQPGGTTANSGGSPGTSFAYFNPSIEGTPTQRLDLYRSVPATGAAVGTPSQFVGYFELSGSGDLTFSPAAAVSTATVSIAQAAYSLFENDAAGKVTVTVVRGGGLSGSASVTLATTAGSAVAGTDYTTTSQSVSFATGETTKTVDVPIANRPGYQGNRVFYVGLSGATGASVIAPGTSVPVTILESDPAATLGSSPSALLTTYGTASDPSSFVVSGSNLTASLTVTPPAGFEVSTSASSGFGSTVTLTPSSGTVSSLAVYIRLAATTAAGTYSGNITVSGGGLASSATLATTSSTVSKAYLTVTSPLASNKPYDGTNAATITGTLTGILNSDNVTLVGTGTFPSAALGTGLAVTSTSTLGGTAAGNYQLLSQPTGLTADITAAPLTITGLTGVNKVYDRTTSATFTGTPAYSGLASGETFSVTGTGSATFASATVGTGKAITVTGFTAPSANYTVTQPTGLTANITAKSLTVNTPAVTNHAFDGGTTAVITGTLSGVIAPDVVTFIGTGTFASSGVGTGIAVTSTSTLGGADAGNYTFTQLTGLTGNIVNSSILTLSQSVYTVTCSTTATTVVNIQVNRTDTSGAFTATLATANGTGIAGTAAGTQYVAVATPGNVVFTTGGSASAIIPVTINKSATTTSSKTFTVTLSGLSSGAGLGTPSTATVVILPPTADATKPTVTITSPVKNATLNDLAPLTISGTVGDNVGISSLVVTLNGTPHTVTLATPTTTTYSLSGLTPQTGTNTITVAATDFNSNTTTATTTFTQLRTLTVNAAAATTTVPGGTVTAGFLGSTNRQVGMSLTITATPSATLPTANGSSIFNGWTVSGATNAEIGIAASALEKQTITFNFKEGMTLTANFVANPYKALAGTYNGLVKSSITAPTVAGTAPSNSTEGFFNALVTSSGGFSGKLTIDTVVLSMAGVFDGNGNARFGTARTLSLIVPSTNGKPSFILDTVHLDTVTAQITAKVTSTSFLRSQVTAVSNISADLAYYDGITKIVPAVYLGAANANGVFTVAFPSTVLGSQPARIAAANYANEDYPQGDGVGMITVTKAGVVSLTGTLADGTPVTASSTLPKAVGVSNVINFALFAKLYSNLGFLSAPVTLDSTQNNTDLAATSGSVLWSKPAQPVQYYPHGWPEVITVDLMGAKYTAPAGQSVLKAPSGANIQAPDADGNATLTFSDGQLTENLAKNVNVSTANAVTIPTGETTFTMTIAPVTGLITGTFTHTDDTKPSYTAVILQKGPSAAGAYGYFLTKQPAVIDYSGESGGVTLIGTP